MFSILLSTGCGAGCFEQLFSACTQLQQVCAVEAAHIAPDDFLPELLPCVDYIMLIQPVLLFTITGVFTVIRYLWAKPCVARLLRDGSMALNLFLVVNAFGEIVKVIFPGANVADHNIHQLLKLFDKLQGWAFTDKAFISQAALEQLLQKGLHLITGIRTNMKNKLMNLTKKILLKKRGMIESINDILKSVCDAEHTRHRSPINALLNVFAGICAYTFLERLPSIFNH